MASIIPPTIIRYHPKALNPYLVTKLMKNLMASIATMKATTFPTISAVRLVVMISMPPSMKSLAILYTVAANMVGTARKNENSAAAFRVSFCAIPPTMVAMERDTPGIIEIHWKSPMMKARFSVIWVFSFPFPNILSQNSMNTPPTISMTATTVTLSSISSMKSLKSRPRTAAGMKATRSFQ